MEDGIRCGQTSELECGSGSEHAERAERGNEGRKRGEERCECLLGGPLCQRLHSANTGCSIRTCSLLIK